MAVFNDDEIDQEAFALLKAELKERRSAEKLQNKQNRPTAIKTSSKIHWALVAFNIVAGVVIELLALILMFAFGIGEDGSSILDNPYVIWGLQIFGMYLIAFPLFIKQTSKFESSTTPKSRLKFGEMIGILFVAEAAMKLGNMLAVLISELVYQNFGIDLSGGNLGDSELVFETPMWLLLFVTVICAPIVEEIMFRKILIDKLSPYGDKMAIAISAITFGLFHGNFIQLVYTTMFGFIVATVYVKTRRIGYCIGYHMLVNLSGTLPSLLLDEGYITEELLVVIYFVPAIIGLIFLVAFRKKGVLSCYNKDPKDQDDYRIPINNNYCEKPIGAYGRARVGFFNAGAITFYLLMILSILVMIVPIDQILPPEYLPEQVTEAFALLAKTL